MQSTCSCPSCDGGTLPLLRTMQVLGHPLTVRNVHCSADGAHYKPYPAHSQLMLTILLTQWCPARCPFCIAGDHSGKRHVDLRRLERTLRALRAEDALNYISISGGEPMSEPELLDEALCMIFEIFGNEMMVGVTSNGMNLDRAPKLRCLHRLDRFRISRHHWDDARNRELFGIATPPAAQLRELITGVPEDDLFALNCLLLRDWVGTAEAVKRHLDFVGEMGSPLAAFITPSPVNEFARAQAVDYREVLRRDDPDLLFTRGFFELDCCRCQDGVALTSDCRPVEFYGRLTFSKQDVNYVRGLVYGADDALRAGYSGEILPLPEEGEHVNR